jgi:hypothetical protein
MTFAGLDFDHERPSRLLDGYRIPYDPRRALHALEAGGDVAAAWGELWNDLHHQGDIGEGSFAAVPSSSESTSCADGPIGTLTP